MNDYPRVLKRSTLCLFVLVIACSLGFNQEVNAQTGDPLVDIMLGGFNQHVVGNNNADPFDHGSNFINCSSGTAPFSELNCPNDSTYMPVESTGGYSAWGVGLEPITAIEWGFDCYLVPIVDFGSGSITFTLVCYPGWNEIPVATVGRAAMRNKWGTLDQSTTSSVSPFTSTLAFKGTDLPVCITVHTGVDSPCDFLPNRTFVPFSGFETEVVVDDPTCDMPTWLLNLRTGTTVDFQYGCFVAVNGNWESDLPGPYVETNAADSEDTFITGIGSTIPEAIIEGTTYDSYLTFYSNGNYVGQTGMEVIPFGTITTFEPLAPACVAAGSDPTSKWCYYSVDSRNITTAETFTW